MKAKVIIENGQTEIVLKPENDFEIDVLEKVYTQKKTYSIHTSVEGKDSYGGVDNLKLVINLKEIK